VVSICLVIYSLPKRQTPLESVVAAADERARNRPLETSNGGAPDHGGLAGVMVSVWRWRGWHKKKGGGGQGNGRKEERDKDKSLYQKFGRIHLMPPLLVHHASSFSFR